MTALPDLGLVAASTPTIAAGTATAPVAESGCGCGGCGCGGGGGAATASELQLQAGDLDVRTIPHAERHARIFEAVAALQPGEAFVLANDHDPKPLRFQLEAKEPGQIDWTYLAQGPELWRVQVGRVAGHCC